MHRLNPLEYYATPEPFVHALLTRLDPTDVLYEPCVGDGAIIRALPSDNKRTWVTNDLDGRWEANFHHDARIWFPQVEGVNWTITNPPFSVAPDILELAFHHSRTGVAAVLRMSYNEPLKTFSRRTEFLREHPPTGLLFLPRYAFQRSPSTGLWATDSVACCWVVWKHSMKGCWIDYASQDTVNALDAQQDDYRRRMDMLVGSLAR